jgi:undecaprenyl-diphosphatase
MEWWQALVLGAVQGLTEFFPISSSGHLSLVPWLFGWEDIEAQSNSLAFDAALHLGTLVAVVVAVRHELAKVIVAGLQYPFASAAQRAQSPHGRLAWLYLLTAVPAAVVGALFDDVIAERLGGPVVVAVSLISFGVVLWWADRRPGSLEATQLSTRHAVMIGLAQVLALNPGTSRSGITISAMRALGYNRVAAVQMSFVIGVPIIGGAGVWQTVKLVRDGLPDGMATALVVGVVTAGVTGWLAISALRHLARRSNFDVFVVYRMVIGIAVLVAVAAGIT